MVFTQLLKRQRIRVLTSLMLAFWLGVPGALSAFECRAVDSNDLPRDCTALEELGVRRSDVEIDPPLGAARLARRLRPATDTE